MCECILILTTCKHSWSHSFDFKPKILVFLVITVFSRNTQTKSVLDIFHEHACTLCFYNIFLHVYRYILTMDLLMACITVVVAIDFAYICFILEIDKTLTVISFNIK